MCVAPSDQHGAAGDAQNAQRRTVWVVHRQAICAAVAVLGVYKEASRVVTRQYVIMIEFYLAARLAFGVVARLFCLLCAVAAWVPSM